MERIAELIKPRTRLGLPAGYDRKCVSVSNEQSAERASKGEAYVVRLKMPEHIPTYTDLVYGQIITRSHENKAHAYGAESGYDDAVLIKSDGCPTYHLANVVDDHCMEISHVIRGAVSQPGQVLSDS